MCARLVQYLLVNSDVPKISGYIYLKSSRCFFSLVCFCLAGWFFVPHEKGARSNFKCGAENLNVTWLRRTNIHAKYLIGTPRYLLGIVSIDCEGL